MLSTGCQVDCGGRDITMAHHLGQAKNITATFEHEGGKSVTELVNGEMDS